MKIDFLEEVLIDMSRITDIKKDDFKGKNNFLAERLLEPWVNSTNSNRGQMFSAHIAQIIGINEAEPPLINTGFENQVFNTSTLGYKKLSGNKLILHKLVKNKFVYYLVVKDLDTGEIDIVKRQEGINLTEHFGIQYDNTTIDSLEVGDEVSDEVIYHDDNYDSEMNAQYGVNLNAAFLSYKGYTNEDAAVISESAAKRLGSTFVKKISVIINNNDIPVNLYGDENNYKVYPELGEKFTDRKPLLAMRRFNFSKLLDFSKSSLQKLLEDDHKIISHGKIIDLDVYSNVPLENLQGKPYYNQILEDYKSLRSFYSNFIDTLKPYIENEDIKVTTNLLSEYNAISRFYYSEEGIVKLTKEDSIFDNLNIEFTVMYHDKASVTNKITNRYGGKNVISLVVPDDEMPVIESINGEPIRDKTGIPVHADICLNPMGVINRLNCSQLIEMEINFISQNIRYRMEEMDSYEDKYKLANEFVSDVSPRTGEFMSEVYNSLSEDEQKLLVDEWIKNGFYIQQEPFWNNINIFDLGELYKKYGITEKYKVKGIETPLIFGEIYYMRLHHLGKDKMSVRNAGVYNYENIPTKTNGVKYSTSYVSSTPIRLGEMETSNLAITGTTKHILDLIDLYGNNTVARNELVNDLLTTNPFNPVIDVNLNNKANNNKILDELLFCIGVKLDIDTEDVQEHKVDFYKMNDEEIDQYLRSKLDE